MKPKHVARPETRKVDKQAAGATRGRGLATLLRTRLPWAVAILSPLLAGCAVLARGAARDPNGLWVVVHDVCVPDQRILANPAPCAEVDRAAGYVVLKDPDPSAPTHALLIPTARITGIEDPAILSPDAPNYWAQAWRARRYVDRHAGRMLMRDELGLAVNSVDGRSQNQLHIHIDCIKPAVKAALQAHADAIRSHWAPFPAPLVGEPYLATRIAASDLDGVNPFRLLAALPEARDAMGAFSLVVTGETGAGGRRGFVLLAGRTTPGFGNRWGEALQDHRCTLARSPERRVAARRRLPSRSGLANRSTRGAITSAAELGIDPCYRVRHDRQPHQPQPEQPGAFASVQVDLWCSLA